MVSTRLRIAVIGLVAHSAVIASTPSLTQGQPIETARIPNHSIGSGSVTATGTVTGTGPSASWIDTTNKDAVVSAFKAEYLSPVPMFGFTGNVASCRPGQTSSSHQARVRDRLNYHRRMAGVEVVTIDDSLTDKAQAAALIGAAEGKITHTVAAGARCYSETGATGAATSSLALGIAGVEAIEAYIDDGVGAMGHRQWMLTSAAHTMATGDVPTNSRYPDSNALTIGLGEERATRDGFVAWPPSGFVPDVLNEKAWTFQYNGADVSQSTVAVTQSGASIPVNIVFQGALYASPTIAFVPTIGKLTRDLPYRVQVDGVLVNGSARTFTYETTFFHIPERPEGTTTYANVTRCSSGKTSSSISNEKVWLGGEGKITATITGDAARRWTVTKSRLAWKNGRVPPSLNDEKVTISVVSDFGWTTTSTVEVSVFGSRRCTSALTSVSAKRKSRISLASLISDTDSGTVRWKATGGCRIAGDVLVVRRSRGQCLLTKTIARRSSTWTITRKINAT